MTTLSASRKYLAALCLIATAVAVSLAARRYSGGLSAHAPRIVAGGIEGAPPVSATAGGAERKDLLVLRLTLSPEGFTPSEVTLPHGRYLLVVYNKSGLEDVDLSLNAGAGHRLHEARAKGRGSRWRDVFEEPPGEYVLGVSDHPDWACRITVTPR